MNVAAFSGSWGALAPTLRLAIISAAFALASVTSQAAPATATDTSGTVSCTGGKCTCRAADYNTCTAVSDQFCGKATMSCTASSGGAVCTCTAKAKTAVQNRRVVAPRATAAAPR